jgi:zinc transport system substrate-binding protein
MFCPMNRLARIFLLSFLSFLFSCGSPEKQSSQKPIVVASIYPVYDWVRQIGGDRVDAFCLIPPGASPHTFSITPEQMRLIAQAKVFFRVGRELEVWADTLLDAAHSSLQVVTLSDGLIKLYVNPEHLTSANDEVNSSTREVLHHEHASTDPHVWLDPILAQDMVKKIAQALTAVDPAGKSHYEQNLAQYLKQLQALDAEIRATVSQLPHKSFVAFHSSFLYFAHRYGLNEAAVIEESPGKDPSVGYLKSLVEFLKKSPHPTVLAEPQLNDKIARTLTTEVQTTLTYVDPLGKPDDPERNTYLNLMRYNLGQLSRALK